jgi:hypothetical protein
MSTLRKEETDSADKLVEGGQRFYHEHLREALEPEHVGRYVAIEPDSGRYFLGDTGTQALLDARQAQPERLFYFGRVGHAAAASVSSIYALRTGVLVLPQSLVTRLGLPVVRREVFKMVGGRQFVAGVALAEVGWLGATSTVRVIISEDTLLGTELLDGTKLVIDYVAHTVTISDEES